MVELGARGLVNKMTVLIDEEKNRDRRWLLTKFHFLAESEGLIAEFAFLANRRHLVIE